jgi:hypothetical protein
MNRKWGASRSWRDGAGTNFIQVRIGLRVVHTLTDTHLLKKVIQADKLGRIDNRSHLLGPFWPTW